MRPGAVETLRGTATTSAAPRGAARAAVRARLGSAAGFLLALSLILADPIEGSGTPPTERVAPSPPTLRMADGRLTARLADVPLERVLDSLADLTGSRIDVDVMPGERVTEAFIDLPLEESLRRLLPGRQIIIVYEQAQHDLTRLVAVRAYNDSGSPTRVRRDRREDTAASSGARMPAGELGGILDLPADRDALALVLSTSQDREARRRAIKELGRLDGDGITAALSLGLEDTDPGVRESAARALGRTWDESAIEPLARAVSDDGDADVREAAAQALGRLWSESAVEALGRALLTDPLRAIREAPARALGDIGGAGGVSALIAALRDPRGSVRESAVAALGAIGGNSAIQALVDVSMTDRDPWVRAEAAAALEEAAGP